MYISWAALSIGDGSPVQSLDGPKSVRKKTGLDLGLALSSDLPDDNGPDEFTATKAIAAAADIRVTALAMRTSFRKRFGLNARGVFIIYSQLEVGV